MRLSDFCNRLQTRAPHRLPDSRMRPSPGTTLPRGSTVRRRARAHLQPMASGAPPGEASLDGEPPASALSQPVSIVRGQVAPDKTMSVMRRGPGGASIECSSALHLPTAALSTASRACDVASDALCRDPARADPAFRSNHPGEAAKHRLRCRPVKDAQLRRHQDAFPRRVLSPLQNGLRRPGSRPPPGRCSRSHPEAQDHRQPATVPPALPPRTGFCHPFAPPKPERARGTRLAG